MAPRPSHKGPSPGPDPATPQDDPPHPLPIRTFARFTPSKVLEIAAAALASTLATAESRRHFCRKVLRGIRILLIALTALYFIPLGLIAVAVHWWAEKNMALAFFAYLPAQIWLLPAPLLILCTLPFSWKLTLLQSFAAAAFVFLYMDYQGAPAVPEIPPHSLTILSYNRGQHLNQSLQPFKDRVKPDIIALQEATGRAPLYARSKGYTEFEFHDDVGEFTFLSKFPIIDKRLVAFPAWGRTKRVASRFEIDYLGNPVAIYVVHMPTVRDTLAYYRRGAFLYGIIGVPGTPFDAPRTENQKYWDERIELARQLEKTIASDPLPCIAVGDFNMPDHGLIYHLFTENLTDAHEISGAGFGFTFPGSSGNPLTLWGPWLRIDYAFCDDDWINCRSLTEKDRASQHRAIAATFALKNRPAKD